MSETQYACTYIEKRATLDDYTTGCEMTSNCVMSEKANIISDTLPGLLAAIGGQLFIEIDDVWIPGEDGIVDRIGYNRLETQDGRKPCARELAAWRKRKLKLWLCDYDLAIEKRTIEPIELDEFKLAGIKFHE